MERAALTPIERITDDELETVAVILRNEQPGRVTAYEWKQIVAELQAWRRDVPLAGFDGRSIVLPG